MGLADRLLWLVTILSYPFQSHGGKSPPRKWTWGWAKYNYRWERDTGLPPDSSLSSVDSADTWNYEEKSGPAPAWKGNNLALVVPLKILGLSGEWLKVPGYYIWTIIPQFTDWVLPVTISPGCILAASPGEQQALGWNPRGPNGYSREANLTTPDSKKHKAAWFFTKTKWAFSRLPSVRWGKKGLPSLSLKSKDHGYSAMQTINT